MGRGVLTGRRLLLIALRRIPLAVALLRWRVYRVSEAARGARW
jgi:hypothetical protein